ncbi:hypothetical protein EXT68_21315 [Pectobacterium parmentieri]|uniref:hypothetical protein n=1 Tax=Pectobacterium TaxID=122277 RepID=UPI00202D2F5D|nr:MULTISPECIES: hypothetical protein [Pectobacterium]MCL6357967.1 hypothetical protein [Pectobacterium parmentieri]MCL6384171.1 hypothetical protein [Pectobacterium parmentieri]MCU1798197.1 hypothetical protein [Pectobacterium polaris]
MSGLSSKHQETLQARRKYRRRGKASGAIRGRVALCLAAGAERSAHCLVEGVVRGDSRMGAGWSHVITEDVA